VVRTQLVALAGEATTWTVVGSDGLPVDDVEAFLEHLRLTGCSPNTIRSYAAGAALWWTFVAAGNLDWRRIGVADVGAFLSWLRFGRGNEPAEATVASRLAAVVAFYRFHEAYHGVDVARRITTVGGRWRGPYRGMLAHLDGRSTDRRVPVVRVRRWRRERPPLLAPDQVEAILDDCARFDTVTGRWAGSLRDRLLFETLAETGMRLGECLALEHGDWHLGLGGVPFIEIIPRLDHPAGLRVKGLRPRRVHISDHLERLYAEWVWLLCDAGLDVAAERCCEETGRQPSLDQWYVFVNLAGSNRMSPLRPWAVYERVRTIKRHLGSAVPQDWTPHWFRHTHATTLLLSGAPELLVSRRLGHADVTTTQNLYGWVTEDAELRCLDWRRLAAGWRTEERPP
jgi:site-specific recombinase XerD